MMFSIGALEKWLGKDIGGDYSTAPLIFAVQHNDDGLVAWLLPSWLHSCN